MRNVRLAVLGLIGLCAAAVVFVVQFPANALVSKETPEPVTGNATWFYGLGMPYGGCGMPQVNLESQDFVALNVYDLPGDYSTFYNRPMDASLADEMGMWDNGHNCGRWVRVTIGDYCTGTNDGATNEAFCREGSWVTDDYNGATLDMLVADSCGDGNAWCRDDPYHLDLARDSLNRFVKDGSPVGDMDPDSWNNRQIEWQFIEAPDYTGDIKIGFLQSAQVWWPAISVSHLPNGIHDVEYYQNGTWQSALMNGDMGQAYIIGGTAESGTQFQIRIRDVNDELINDGRVYSFTFPDSCGTSCNGAYTETEYTTSTEPVTPSADPSTSGICTAEYVTTGSWPDGFMATVTVSADDVAVEGWTVRWTLGADQTLGDVWDAVKSVDGSEVTVTNVAWNRTIEAGSSRTFGLVGTGTTSVPALTCTSP
ncbi:MAG: cellulose-binding protein [Dactylosporangium sp.]|nr:cellulose binding domain-containing protein [Dactylosporangium sp.]NNJ60549.1 cellulose-binding protein [Dactylosporangium sp.]